MCAALSSYINPEFAEVSLEFNHVCCGSQTCDVASPGPAGHA